MPSNGIPLPSTSQALQRITMLQISEHSLDTVLQAIVDETSAVLPGHVDASLTVLIGSRPATAAYCGQLALDLDETQYGTGHGPCLHAAATGELVEVTDARAETRWVDYMRRAVQRGSLSSLALPLPVSGLAGALNIYAAQAHGFDDAARAAAGQFADAAASTINNVHVHDVVRDKVRNLELALESRAVIDQAKGIVMERRQLAADKAFQLLTSTSQLANVKLRAVAEHLILTGELLTPAPPRAPRRSTRRPN
jgi:hypothetical protein